MSVTIGISEHEGQRIVIKQAVLKPDGVEVSETPISEALR
jgi:hypothetical protein